MERNLKTAERMLKQWDANGDGVVTTEEFNKNAADRFAKQDPDGNRQDHQTRAAAGRADDDEAGSGSGARCNRCRPRRPTRAREGSEQALTKIGPQKQLPRPMSRGNFVWSRESAKR